MRNSRWVSLLAILLALVSIVLSSLTLARPPQHSTFVVPATMSHQGFLVENGTPVNSTVALKFGLYSASSGGSPLWEETHNSVAVTDGYYTVLLGSQTPLTAGLFSSATRYLQISADTGGGYVDLPRQVLSSVPYAFQASQADVAPWSGLTGIPAGFADGVDNEGGNYDHVITVSPSGGDFTSVAAALSSISGSSSTNRYLVWVGPGVYTETALVTVPAYVHLQGAGTNATVVTSDRSSSSAGNAAATVELLEDSTISDMSVWNTGIGTYNIALYSIQTSRDTLINNVVAEVKGSGGTGHYAVYLNDAELTIRDSILRVNTGIILNVAVYIRNIGGPAPEPYIQNSMLLGGTGGTSSYGCNNNYGVGGYGIWAYVGSPRVVDSYICGDYRAIYSQLSGVVHVHHSQVSVTSTAGSFLLEPTAGAKIVLTSSGVFYSGNKVTGLGILVCTHNYKADYTAATDGTTIGTACN